MINSFIDMVNESSNQPKLVDEMGVKKPERLSGSQMGRIRQDTINLQRARAERPPQRSFQEVAYELNKKLKQIRRLDITMETPGGTRKYYPRFPMEIVELMRELKAIDQSRFRSEFGKWRDVYESDSEAIYFKTESPSDFQRSHFPNGGIPPSLRGLGLGYKLYRTLLKFAGYISSNTSGTEEKDKAWGSMLTYKSNPDGTPSEDDAHAVIGPNNWLAIDKGLSLNSKLEVAQRFIRDVIGLSSTREDRFDIDDELLNLLPDTFLVQLNQGYIQGLVRDGRLTPERRDEILARQSEAQRLEQERIAREEAAATERRAREEAVTRKRLAKRIAQYGASPDEPWEVGDYIVVKSYLYDASYSSLPIRKVILRRNGEWVASGIDEVIQIESGQVRPEQARDTRTTSNPSSWVKVKIQDIPDLTRVNLSTAGIAYIRQQIAGTGEVSSTKPISVATPEPVITPIAEPTAEPNRERASSVPGIAVPRSGRELKQEVLDRNGNRDMTRSLSVFKRGDFAKFIVLHETQLELFRSSVGIPVMVPFYRERRSVIGVESSTELLTRELSLMNMLTGEETPRAMLSGSGLVALQLLPVTEADKLSARAGDHFYIANHQNAYGLIGKCDYSTRNTIDQPFIYLRIYGAERPVPIRLDLLRKFGERIDL
jgi:hypothetical protein